MKRHFAILTALVAMIALLSACAAPGPTGQTSPPPGQGTNSGTIQIWVTDAPRSDNVTEIWLTVTEVKIHKAIADQQQANDSESNEAEGEIDESEDTGEWVSASFSGSNRFELLRLRGEDGGLHEILATADMAPGRYTQIRMTIEKVEVTIDGVLKDAILPSHKLKFVHPFDVEADKDTKLLFDFDADKLVHVTGSPKEPKIMVKPVVKMIVSKPAASEAAVKITTPSLPNGAVGRHYEYTMAATGGTLPYDWSLLAGDLPDGLTLRSDGLISGTPDAGTADNYTFTVRVSDNSTPVKSNSRQYKITIAETNALIITTTSLVDGKDGIHYSTELEAIGGTPPYSWSVINGNLPDDLTLDDDTGEISGTPSKKGNYNFTVQVTDNATPANTATQHLNIRISQG